MSKCPYSVRDKLREMARISVFPMIPTFSSTYSTFCDSMIKYCYPDDSQKHRVNSFPKGSPHGTSKRVVGILRNPYRENKNSFGKCD